MLYNAKAFKGGNNQLLVAVEPFNPQVTCQGPLDTNKEICGEIISSIAKSYRPRRFGRPGDRAADTHLPFRIVSRKHNWIPNYG